uniref:Ion transport domain-containing protein n=1 Tax=Anopheles maculatus TaxID=74869 RepID=A0A182SRR9_9DIPT
MLKYCFPLLSSANLYSNRPKQSSSVKPVHHLIRFFIRARTHSKHSINPISSTGYLEQGLLVRDAPKLRKHYFSKQRWWLDIVSMLPTDLAYIWWAPSSCAATRLPCPIIVRINRLLRLPRMWEWFDRTETATGYPNAFRICKVSGARPAYQAILTPF